MFLRTQLGSPATQWSRFFPRQVLDTAAAIHVLMPAFITRVLPPEIIIIAWGSRYSCKSRGVCSHPPCGFRSGPCRFAALLAGCVGLQCCTKVSWHGRCACGISPVVHLLVLVCELVHVHLLKPMDREWFLRVGFRADRWIQRASVYVEYLFIHGSSLVITVCSMRAKWLLVGRIVFPG